MAMTVIVVQHSDLSGIVAVSVAANIHEAKTLAKTLDPLGSFVISYWELSRTVEARLFERAED